MSRTESEPRQNKICVENTRRLDVRMLCKAGLLQQGRNYGWSWLSEGQVAAKIRLYVHPEHVVVRYRFCRENTKWQAATCDISLVRTPCHLGGERIWWRCPQPGCDRRVALLYATTHIACRRCHDLAYWCQRETVEDRAARQANKVRHRLGWDRGVFNESGGKPKGMHLKTYVRLLGVYHRHEQIVLVSIADSLGLSLTKIAYSKR